MLGTKLVNLARLLMQDITFKTSFFTLRGKVRDVSHSQSEVKLVRLWHADF